MYRLSEHSLTIETGRQTWLSKEERLCPHSTENQVETELHFLTSCSKYKNITDTFYPLFTTRKTSIKNQIWTNKLPESPASSNLASYVCEVLSRRKSLQQDRTTNYTPRDTDVNNRRFQIFIAMFIFRERERERERERLTFLYSSSSLIVYYGHLGNSLHSFSSKEV